MNLGMILLKIQKKKKEDNLPEAPNTGDGDQETEEEESEEETEEEGRKETGGSGSIQEGSTPDQYDDEDGARESLTEHNATTTKSNSFLILT